MVAQERSNTMENFSMEDVKELLFNQTLAAYQEKKNMLAYIKQLEDRVKELEDSKTETKNNLTEV